ncbi:DUF6960 family protein [Massilia pseudoviolaceinigra]|uniref:DUF6960 family protein n=1 Tax=Massilia pseudoviolaceinigra TaxID=3057165 RepID=UPI002796D886|nr:hypothetical protein [Massilia sp. CCM 9206]MDQ1920683.1 hypothetical protein [Massilia sp. CCM 9206]
MPPRPSRFALYNWFPEDGADLVHPDDLAAFAAMGPPATVFGVGADAAGWVLLDAGQASFRVRADLLRPLPAPRYWVGDTVRFIKSGVPQRGIVARVGWHFKEAAPMYYVSQDGKRLKKTYHEQDLSPINAESP